MKKDNSSGRKSVAVAGYDGVCQPMEMMEAYSLRVKIVQWAYIEDKH
ncbi:MAG: hypothetical protein IKX65_06820 [Prevotella sp.]|nr:hypothetical protein [Prevotella sp.]